MIEYTQNSLEYRIRYLRDNYKLPLPVIKSIISKDINLDITIKHLNIDIRHFIYIVYYNFIKRAKQL